MGSRPAGGQGRIRAPESWTKGPLLDLAEVSPQYRSVAKALLGDVYVVEKLEDALTLWDRNGTNATLVFKRYDA